MHKFVQTISKTKENKFVWTVSIVNGQESYDLFTSVCEFDTVEEAKHDLFVVNTFLNMQRTNEWEKVPTKTDDTKKKED